ncbi:MAG TPA: endospore germination permease [Syntrophomonadaceae bacterium]|nr:endospore germination permease [Syntrophomonadaceae bacterium]
MGIEQGKISRRQALFLVSNAILATMVLYVPALLAQETGQDAWVTVILAGAGGVLYGAIVVFLGARFPDKNLVEYSIELLGPWAGRAVGMVFGLFFLYLNGVVIREFSELLVSLVMPETPLVVFDILIVSLAAYGVYLGLEVFARVNEILFPTALFVGLGFIALAIPEMEFYHLKPALVHSFPALLRGSVLLLSFYLEGTALLMFYPALRRPEEGKPISYQVGFILAIAILVDILGVIAMFGPEEAARLIFPTFELAKTVHLGGFVERIESLIVGIWITMGGLKVMVFYYVSVLAFAESWGLRDYRPLVLPTGMILAALAVLEFADTNQIRTFFRCVPAFTVTVLGGITVFLYLITLIRAKRTGGKTDKDD